MGRYVHVLNTRTTSFLVQPIPAETRRRFVKPIISVIEISF